MRASLTITGIEVELSIPAGPLETIAAGRYAPFLGETRAPVCSLRVEAFAGLRQVVPVPDGADAVVQRESATVYRVGHPGFLGRFDLDGAGDLRSEPGAAALDDGLRTLFALLAPRHDGFLLTARGVIGADGAHLFAGPAALGRMALPGDGEDRPVLIDGYVMVRRLDGAWLAGSTPFRTSAEAPGPPREARLARLWALRSCPAAEPCPPDTGAALHAVMDSAYVPGRESEARRAVLDLAVDLAAVVPSGRMFLAAGTGVRDDVEISLT